MEYNDLSTFERLTGRALFAITGQAGAIDLGNIEMLKLDYGLKSIDDKASVRGRLQLRRRKYTEALPVYSIDGNQFVTPQIPLLLLGDQIDDYSQAVATGNTFTFTAVSGLAFLLPAYGLTNVSVRVGSTLMTAGTDYFLDDPNVPQTGISNLGLIQLPVNPQGIQDGDVVVVTFDQPNLTMNQYRAFTKLDRTGTLTVFAEDGAAPAREIWIMSVSLSCKKGSDTDPSKFRKFTLEAAVLADPIVRKPSAFAIDIWSLGVGGDTFAWE